MCGGFDIQSELAPSGFKSQQHGACKWVNIRGWFRRRSYGGRFLVVLGNEQDLALDRTLDTAVISHEECWKGREDDGDSSRLKANIQML